LGHLTPPPLSIRAYKKIYIQKSLTETLAGDACKIDGCDKIALKAQPQIAALLKARFDNLIHVFL
jgi:hypothetical protein